jgi:hypothetical protein
MYYCSVCCAAIAFFSNEWQEKEGGLLQNLLEKAASK